MSRRHARAPRPHAFLAVFVCSLVAVVGAAYITPPSLLGEEPPSCNDRCEAKLVRITVGKLLKVEVYNRDGKLVSANPLVKPDDVGLQELLKRELDAAQEPVPIKGKGCEKGCRCVTDRNDPNLKWIENPGDFTISATFSHFAGKDVFTWKVKREVTIASGICDIEPKK